MAYASRSLSLAERNYGISELETLAVVWAITHFRRYVYGNDVAVFTDHSAVRAILETPNPNGKHVRWWTKVYGCGARSVKIHYRQGRENDNADALSRCPQSQAPLEGTSEGEVQIAAVISTDEHTIQALLQQEPVALSDQESFATKQQQDPSMRIMINFLKNETLPEDPDQAQKVAA